MAPQSASDLITEMAGLPQLAGHHLGFTEWTEITQEQISAFADLTGDHNFLHVDPERAKDTPFGGTIAHGFLMLSMIAPVTQRLRVSDAVTSVNYGLDKLRFPAPVPAGGLWRGGAEVLEATEIQGGAQVRMNAVIEVKGSDKPAVVAECLFRFYK